MLFISCSSSVTQKSGVCCRMVCARYNRGTVQRRYLRKKKNLKKSERKIHGAAQTSPNGVKSNVFIISHMMIFSPVVFQLSYSHNSSRQIPVWKYLCSFSPVAALTAWLTTEDRKSPLLWYTQIGLLLELIQHHYFLTENVFLTELKFPWRTFFLQTFNFSFGKKHIFVSRLFKIHFPFHPVPKEARQFRKCCTKSPWLLK